MLDKIIANLKGLMWIHQHYHVIIIIIFPVITTILTLNINVVLTIYKLRWTLKNKLTDT